MNLLLHSHHTSYPAPTARLLETELLELAGRYRAEEIVVRLTDEREASPRYHVTIFVRLPGPDVHVSATDHTAAVAARKAIRLLENCLVARADRRRQRRRSNLQHSSAARTGRAW
jgi:ribosome-associated translation inhibitor RaiA